MKNRSNKKEDSENTNVEFGIEFGDINGAKLIEYPFMNQKQTKIKKKKK